MPRISSEKLKRFDWFADKSSVATIHLFLKSTIVLAFGSTGAFASAQLSAQASQPVSRAADVKSSRSFIYHGKLVRPDGTTPDGSVSVTLKILSPDPKLCALWVETQTVSVKQGGFSAELGHTINRLPGAAGGAAADFKQAFINNPSLTISSAACESGNSYTPTVSDDRLLSATFNDGGNIVEIAGLPVKSVPFALQAEEIGGYGLANLVKISGAGNNATLTPAQIDELKAMSDTTLPFDMKARLVKNAADPVDPQDLVTKAYYQANLPTGTGVGSVTNVSAAGVLSVTNGTTTPNITISQASATTSGYLSSANWNTFNDKLGSALATGMVFHGNGSNVAAPSYFGIGQMRNAAGTLQMPTACAAAQTLTWSAVTDVLACSNIDGLNADKITAGTIAVARLGTGTADATKYLRGDGTWQTLPSGADNLGNHAATQNLNLASYQLVGNGGSTGIAIGATGNVGIGVSSPSYNLDVGGLTRFQDAVTIPNKTGLTGYGQALLTLFPSGSNGLHIAGNSSRALLELAPSSGVGLKVITTDFGQVQVSKATSTLNDVAGMQFAAIPAGVAPTNSSIEVGAALATANGANSINDFVIRSKTGSSPTEVLRIFGASGNVGIGTSSPSEKLDVAGKVKGTELCIGADCRSTWPTSGGGGAVQSVNVGGLPLSVVNSSTTPVVSIAQANTTTAGYLSDTDWNTFNNKQSTTLATGQVWVGNGSNLASAQYFGLGQLRSTATGNVQFPSSCGAHQTMVWSAITDVLACSNINNLDGDKITAGTIAAARLGSGTADASKYLRGDGTWQTLPSGADHLGNHTATQNLNLASFKLVGNGGTEGINISSAGNVGIGTTTPGQLLSVNGTIESLSGGIKFPDGTIQTTSATGGSNNTMLSGWPDAIQCNVTTPAWGTTIFYVGNIPSGGLRYYLASGSSSNYAVVFNNAGTYNSTTNSLVTSDCTGTISSIVSAGRSFSFAKGPAAQWLAGASSAAYYNAGNVGIGTSTPGAKLDVAGTINATGMTINGVAVGTGGGSVNSFNGAAQASQTVAIGTSSPAPAWVTNTGTGAHTLHIPMASTAGTTAGLISKTDYDAFSNKLGTGSSLAGDVTGTPAATVVDRIKGVAVSAAPTTTGQILRYNGTQLTPAFLSMFDLRSTITGSNAFSGVGCLAHQTLTWTAATDNLACTDITNLDANKITAGTINTARLGSGTADATKFLRGDGTWAVPAGGGGSAGPTFSVSRNGSNQTISTGVWTKINWTLELFDTNNNFASDKFTPTVAGKYYADFVAACAGGGTCNVALYKNGAAYVNNFSLRAGNSSAQISAVIDMNGSSDYLEAYINTDTATTISGVVFSGGLIGGGGGGSGTPGGSTTQLQFNDGGSFAGASGFVWDKTNSRVGVGTTTPNSPLEVAGVIHSTSGGIKFPDGSIQTTSATSGTNNTMLTGWPDAIVCYVTNPAWNASLVFQLIQVDASFAYYRTADPGSNYDVKFVAGTKAFSGYNNLTTTDCNASISSLYSSGKAFNFAKGPAGQWSEASGNAYRNTGNVGIGTTSPNDLLVVAANTNAYTRVRTRNANTGVGAGTGYYFGSDVDSDYGSYIVLNGSGNASNFAGAKSLNMVNPYGDMSFSTGTAGPNERMRIQSNGNVGIGTTTPTTKLEVNGTAKATTFDIGYQQVTASCGSAINAVCTATCPGSKVVIGGGCFVSGGWGVAVRGNYPAGGNTWNCISDSSSTIGGVTLTTYAICASVQ